jgi:integrase
VDAGWWISYRDPEGKYRRRKIGPDRRAAGRVLAKVQTELAEGSYIDRRASCNTTLAELRDGWLAHIKPERSEVNYNNERTRWPSLIRLLGESTRADKISETTLERYRRRRVAEGMKPASINRELGALSSTMSWAVRHKLLQKRPRFDFQNPRNERLRFLSKDEARRLLLACPDEIRGFVQAALATGCRRGELLKMRWSWVDLRTGMIGLPATATKNKTARHVPVSDDMREVLLEARERAVPGCPFVLQKAGEPIKVSRLQAMFKTACEKAGISDLHIHDLRHTAASWMVQAGVDLYSVALVLGHKSIRMTQRYAHLAPDHLQAAIQAVNFTTDARPTPGADPGHQVNTGRVVKMRSKAISRG